MKSEIKALQKALKNRKAELENLIVQMKSDQLNKSAVFKHLQEELVKVDDKLNPREDSK
jgi:ribosomal protein L29